jgi:hypothetical protein
MVSWVRRQRDKIERVEAEADALIHNLGAGAYSAARRREHEATSEAMARHWRRVALAVARKTARRVGLDTSTRMATDADFTSEGNPGALRPDRVPKRLRHWRRHAEARKVR